jgi:dTMP kinase
VTLEGPEGAGKTTQAARLLDAFASAGVAAVLVREPGGTALGEAIRSILLDGEPGAARIAPRADALLFNAARAQLVAEQVEPALVAGTTVLCSRFADSTLAYQGAGMGLPLDDLRALERFATGGLRPDLTLLLDLPVEVGLARKRGVEETRFESGFDVAFHRRVRDGFLALAAAEPARFVTLDARESPDLVFDRLVDAVERRLHVALPSFGRVPARQVRDREPAVAADSGARDPNARDPNGDPARITR